MLFFYIFTRVMYLQGCLFGRWLVTCVTGAVSAHVLCTPYRGDGDSSVVRVPDS